MSWERESEEPMTWVSDLADTLIREILEQMAGIHLRRCPPPPGGRTFLSVFSAVEGAYHTELAFCAEPQLLRRVAVNMLEDPKAGLEDGLEYTMEIFNVFCGRFISEIYRETRIPARFYTPRHAAGKVCLTHTPVQSLYYLSDREEQACFYWTASSIAEILTRGKENG